MPKPSLRTRSRKRRSLHLPGGRVKIFYKREGTSSARCSRCGKPLSGVRSGTAQKIRKLSLSQRRVERPHGGQLCPACLRELLKRAVRGI